MASKKKTGKSQRRKADASTAEKRQARLSLASALLEEQLDEDLETPFTAVLSRVARAYGVDEDDVFRSWNRRVSAQIKRRKTTAKKKTAGVLAGVRSVGTAVAKYEMENAKPPPRSESGWARREARLARLRKKVKAERDKLARLLKK